MRNNSICSNEDEEDEMIKMSKISQIKETNEIRDDMLIYELNNGMCCCGNKFHYKDKLPVYFSFTEKSLIGCFHPTFSIKECKKYLKNNSDKPFRFVKNVKRLFKDGSCPAIMFSLLSIGRNEIETRLLRQELKMQCFQLLK